MQVRKRVLAMLCCLAMAFCMALPTFAAEASDHGHMSGKVGISGSVTHSDNADNSGANTQFFLYIENPLEVSALPKTGDYGLELTPMILAALAAGSGFLACGAYAKHKR